MKKRDFHKRIKTLFKVVKEYFIEEEPRDKARRTIKNASKLLNKTVYQRIALEYELKYRNLDEESRSWCQKTLEAVRQSEQEQSEQLAVLREEYRKLALQDLLYQTLREPNADIFEQAHESLMELSAAVEAEKTLQNIPKLLDVNVEPPKLPVPVDKEEDNG